MQVKIIPLETNSPSGKLADAELHFEEGVLEGLKLIGFAVWNPGAVPDDRSPFLHVSIQSTANVEALRFFEPSPTPQHKSA